MAENYVASLKDLYPELDIASELRSIQAWYMTHMDRLPGSSDEMLARVNAWLQKSKREFVLNREASKPKAATVWQAEIEERNRRAYEYLQRREARCRAV